MVQWLRIHLPMQETWVQFLSEEDSPGGGNGNPLQYSCLENPMDRGARQSTVHGVAESDTTEQLTLLLSSLNNISGLIPCAR